jgi:hypothetical protein
MTIGEDDPIAKLKSAFKDPSVIVTEGETVGASERPTLTPREAAQEAAGQRDPLDRIAAALEKLNAQLETGATITDANGRQALMSVGNALALIVTRLSPPQAGPGLYVPAASRGGRPY